MPLKQTLRGLPRSKSMADLRSRMANLVMDPDPIRLLLPPRQPNPITPNHRLFEISDDSDSTSPSPSPVPRVKFPHPPTRDVRPPGPPRADQDELFCVPSDFESDESDDSDDFVQLAFHRHKRTKITHPPPTRQLPAKRLQPISSRNERSFSTKTPKPASSSSLHIAPAVVQPAQPEPAPYYHDTKLNVDMYRGPGYDKFPVALGTVEGHQQIVDEWTVQGHTSRTLLTALDNVSTQAANKREEQCMKMVKEVFPDVETAFMLQKIRETTTQLDLAENQPGEDPISLRVISQIADMNEYPKEKPSSSAIPRIPADQDETGVTVVYDRYIPKNGPYQREAVRILASDFIRVPTHHINKVVRDKRSLFDSYLQLREAEDTYFTIAKRPYTRLRQGRVHLEKKYYRSPWETRDEVVYRQMVNEYQAARQHVAREEFRKTRQKEKQQAEELNMDLHVQSGSLVECQCCFDDEVPLNRCVGCLAEHEVHFFCFSCVNQLADTQLGMIKYEMMCMDGSGCKAALSPETVAQAVPVKTLDRLANNQQQAEIMAAGIEGLEQCPYCDFKAICDPVEEDSEFNCMNPDCRRASCRRCKAASHVPKTCEEAKVDTGLNARHRIEEARTDSVLRTCPKCGVKIIKELGCNKLVCTSCRCSICYVCKMDISGCKEAGYEHFHKPGSKCKLHDELGIDRHELEANEAEKEAIKKAKAEDADLDEKQLFVGTGPGQTKAKKAPAPRPDPPPHLFDFGQMPDGLEVLHAQLNRHARANEVIEADDQEEYEGNVVYVRGDAPMHAQIQTEVQAQLQAQARAQMVQVQMQQREDARRLEQEARTRARIAQLRQMQLQQPRPQAGAPLTVPDFNQFAMAAAAANNALYGRMPQYDWNPPSQAAHIQHPNSNPNPNPHPNPNPNPNAAGNLPGLPRPAMFGRTQQNDLIDGGQQQYGMHFFPGPGYYQ